MAIAIQLDPSKVDRAQRLPTLKPVGLFALNVAYEVDDETGQRAMGLPDSPFMRVTLKEARTSGQLLDSPPVAAGQEEPGAPQAATTEEAE
jgi:hypothetical protein